MANTTIVLSIVIAIMVTITPRTTAAQDSSEPWVAAIGSPQFFALYVNDVDKSVTWYKIVFGLRALGGSRADDGSWRIENLGNGQLLVEIIRDSRTQEVDRAFGFRKVGFFVSDVEEVADRIESETGERPRVVEFEELEQRILQIRDPDGNVVQLMSPLESGE